jgi:hypothetical protein
MFVRNATKNEKQQEFLKHIIERVGISTPNIGMIEIMAACCVGNVITHSTKNTNSKPLVSPNY